MCVETITRKFPLGEELGLEPEQFKSLLREAIHEFSNVLLTSETEFQWPHTVYYKHEGGISSKKIQSFPIYEQISRDKEIKKTLLSGQKVKDLLDYIWIRGAMPFSFQGPDPQRSAWESYVVNEILNDPLCRVLDRAAHNEAIRSGNYTKPTISKEDIEKIQDELILRFCHNQYRFIATCPLYMITGEPGTVWQLSDGIRLRIFTEEEKFRYLSQIDYFVPPLGYSNKDMILWGTAVLEITATISMEQRKRGNLPKIPTKLPTEIISELIADRIDVVKLAISLAFDMDIPPKEGTIICEDIFGDYEFKKLLSFARERQGVDEFSSCNMTSDKEEIVRKLVGDFLTIHNKSPDLKQAIWHWGRSSTSILPRDIVLEAVIGLERLLVQGGGNPVTAFVYMVHRC